MYKKIVTYEDFNGKQHTDELYFHLSKPKFVRIMAKYYPELIKGEDISGADTQEIVQRIIRAKDPIEMVDMLENLIQESYGVKSIDGSEFEQSKEMSEKFSHTNAYEAVFFDLLTKPDEQKAFFTGVIPSDFSSDALKEYSKIVGIGDKTVADV